MLGGFLTLCQLAVSAGASPREVAEQRRLFLGGHSKVRDALDRSRLREHNERWLAGQDTHRGEDPAVTESLLDLLTAMTDDDLRVLERHLWDLHGTRNVPQNPDRLIQMLVDIRDAERLNEGLPPL